ncbi:MAG: ABC transporter ATP-binding protein [Actinomycetota bacterium]
MTALVSLEGIQKSFRRGPEVVNALKGVHLSLLPGQVCAIVGPSGSGKSTLLNVIAGWETPDSGVVLWKDEPRNPIELGWETISLVPQRLGLLEDLTVLENIELPLVLAGTDQAEVTSRSGPVLEALDLVDLADRLPAETSLGEQQRACIARSLVIDPELLLADEPTGNQDHARERKVLTAFRAAALKGATCLIATHNPEVMSHCDRVVTMHDGEIVSDEVQAYSPWARSGRER